MLLGSGHSGLVGLSDSLKTTVALCAKSAWSLHELTEPHRATYREVQQVARQAWDGKLKQDEANSRIKELLAEIPIDVSQRAGYLQAHEIHSLSCAAVILSCVCLESYINTLAYFLFQEMDFLSLISHGHRSSAEVLLDAVARMTIRDKWKTVGKLSDANGFDPSRAPFQDFQVLFRFRNDYVHDKVVQWGAGSSKDPYDGKFPKNLGEPLDLAHALYAANTYWVMVEEVHHLTKVPQADFQRHYDLRPWVDDGHRRELHQIAARVRGDSASS